MFHSFVAYPIVVFGTGSLIHGCCNDAPSIEQVTYGFRNHKFSGIIIKPNHPYFMKFYLLYLLGVALTLLI